MLIGDKLTQGLSNLDNLIKQLISNNLSSLARDVFPDEGFLFLTALVVSTTIRCWPELTGTSRGQHCNRSLVKRRGQSIRGGPVYLSTHINCIGSWSLGWCDQTFFVRSFHKYGMANVILLRSSSP